MLYYPVIQLSYVSLTPPGGTHDAGLGLACFTSRLMVFGAAQQRGGAHPDKGNHCRYDAFPLGGFVEIGTRFMAICKRSWLHFVSRY